MAGEAFLLVAAQIGVAIAGFAALVGSLRPSSAGWTRIDSFLLMALITIGLGIMPGTAVTLVAFEFTHDSAIAVRIGTLVMLLPWLWRLVIGACVPACSALMKAQSGFWAASMLPTWVDILVSVLTLAMVNASIAPRE